MRDRTVLRQRLANQERHERVHDRMHEVRQEHEHLERPESPAGHGRALQGGVDASRGESQRAGTESLLGDPEAVGRDVGVAYQRLSHLPARSQTLHSCFRQQGVYLIITAEISRAVFQIPHVELTLNRSVFGSIRRLSHFAVGLLRDPVFHWSFLERTTGENGYAYSVLCAGTYEFAIQREFGGQVELSFTIYLSCLKFIQNDIR